MSVEHKRLSCRRSTRGARQKNKKSLGLLVYRNFQSARSYDQPATQDRYMGDNYWFLSKEIQIQGGALLPANEVKYLTKAEHQLSNSFLVISEELFDKSISLEINESEANVLLLHGPKNVGKTLTQHVVHYGQGGLDLCHNLLLSGGNQTSSGTSMLKGRVMRVEYHRSHQSMEDEEKLVELKAICTRYKMHIAAMLGTEAEEMVQWNGCCPVHTLYLVTSKEDCMLPHHFLNVIQRQDEDSMEEKTLVEKLEENIIRKIQANETHIFTWLNWHFKVQCLSTKTRVAIAIKPGIVIEEFTDISSHELHTCLEDKVKNGWSVSVTFARDSNGCTPIELSQLANNTTSTRAHKIPIRVFSKGMEKWLDFDLNGGEKPGEKRNTSFEQLTDEQMAEIENIDDTIKQKFKEMNENTNATADDETDDLLGLQYGLQKQIQNREEFDAVGEIDEGDF
eukprot:gene1404-1550_t